MSTLQERLRDRELPLDSVTKAVALCREAADRLDELEREVAALRAVDRREQDRGGAPCVSP